MSQIIIKKYSKDFKLETILKATAINKLIEKQKREKSNNPEEYLLIKR